MLSNKARFWALWYRGKFALGELWNTAPLNLRRGLSNARQIWYGMELNEDALKQTQARRKLIRHIVKSEAKLYLREYGQGAVVTDEEHKEKNP